MATFFSHAWIALNFSNSSSPKHNYNIHFLQSLISHTNDCKKAMDPSSPWSTWRRAKWRAPAGSGAAPPRWWRPPSRSRSSNPPPSPCTSSSPSSTTHNTPKIKNRLATHEKQVLPRPQITPSNNSNGRENSRGSRSLRRARTRRPPGSCASWRRRRGAPRAAPPPRGRRPPTRFRRLPPPQRRGGGAGQGGTVRRGSGLLRRHPASALEWKVLEARSGRLGNETKGNEPKNKLSPRVARVRWNLWRQMGDYKSGFVCHCDVGHMGLREVFNANDAPVVLTGNFARCTTMESWTATRVY